jgi:tetratricopeptide (TPR) repeat protein
VTRAELDDERSFLLDSLEDLERERAAGDLSDEDYVALRDSYTKRAADVLRALERDRSSRDEASPQPDDEEPGDASTSPPPPRRRRGLLVAGLSTLVLAVAATLVVTQTGVRLPGQTETGSVRLSSAAQLRETLAQAESLQSSGNEDEALRLYEQILSVDPTQPDALTQAPWLEFEAGVKSRNGAVLAQAQAQEQAAERVDPGAYAPHLYLGSMYLAEGDAAAAVTQYRQFLADRPPTSEVLVAQPFITQAFGQAHQPVPALPGVAAAPTTTAPSGR